MNSIYRKIFFFAVILFFSVMTISTVLNIRETQRILTDEKTHQAKTVLRSLLEKCKYAITVIDNVSMEAYIDRKSLDDFVQDIIQNESDVTEILLINRKGMILSSMNNSRKNQLLPAFSFEKRYIKSGEIAKIHNKKNHSLRVLGDIQISGVSWGTALIDFSMLSLEQRVNNLTYQALGTGVILLTLLVILLIPLVGTIVKPIQQLSHFAEEIGNGNLDQEIEIVTNDEVGHLARTFSIMARKLKMTMDTLEKRMIDLHHSEDLLKKSEKKYRNIFENAVEGIFQVGIDGAFISVNPAGAEMLGYNSESEMRHHLSNQVEGIFVDSSDLDALMKIINEKHQVTDYEMRLIRKDKQIIDVAISVRGVFDSNRQLVMFGGFVQNIMERKQKEAAEREIVAAKVANEAKSAFLATMGHEIRTPLNAVTGFSDLLSSLVTDEKQKSYLSAIKCSGNNLLLLINDILDLSKIEAGRLELQYSPVDLRILLKEVEQIFVLQIQNKAIQFFVNISSEMPDILYLDKLRLRQILINLVGNAVKFTNKGFVKLSVDVLSQKDDSRLDIHISVEDTGIGVSEEDMGIIFDAFKRQTNLDSSRYKGTGLGLTICKRLVEMMNGRIDVESVAGQGSTFTIIVNDVKSKTKNVSKFKEQVYHENIEFENSKVLVVDDVEFSRIFLKELLKKMNLDIFEAENGQESIAITHKYQPDVILMDIQMPVMDGIEATRQLKNDQKTKSIPIIGVTAASSAMTSSSIMEKGFDGLLLKPLERNKLLFELLKYLPVANFDDQQNRSKKREITDEWQTLSSKALSKVPELIRILDSEYLDQWNKFAKRQPIQEVEKFGKDLRDLGLEYSINPLTDYGERLLVHVDSFDVAGMLIMIDEFTFLMSKLKAIKKENA